MDENREQELREDIYTKRKSKQLIKEFKDYEMKEMINLANANFRSTSFNDEEISDITFSIRRLTQFLYLFIKGRDQNKKLKSGE